MYSLFIIFDTNPTRNAWDNWSFLTIFISVLGAAGGILVAATLKYADAILKTLATAGSIVISTVLGHFFLNGPLDLVVSIGATTVILAIFNYTMDTTGTVSSSTGAAVSDKDKRVGISDTPSNAKKDDDGGVGDDRDDDGDLEKELLKKENSLKTRAVR